MVAFYIALVLGILIGITYVALAISSFRNVRDRILGRKAELPARDPHWDEQTHGFTWKASIGVITSVALLAALSISPAFWYVLPFLALGTGVAVIVAFLVDPDGSL